MPRVKKSASETRYDAIRRNVRGAIFTEDLSARDVADKIGCSAATLYRKLGAPDTFTVGELMRIASVTHTSLEALIGTGHNEFRESSTIEPRGVA